MPWHAEVNGFVLVSLITLHELVNYSPFRDL